MKGFVKDIESLAVQNDNFRQVLYTAKHCQLVVMALQPREEIGAEVHELDQFFRVEDGNGEAVLDGVRTAIRVGNDGQRRPEVRSTKLRKHAMKSSTLTRLALTVALSAALASISFASHAQHGQDVSAPHKAAAQQDKQEKQENKDEKKEAKKQQQQQHRLSQEQQQERIRLQKQRLAAYKQRIAEQQALALRDAQQMEQQRRLAQYRYQQAYYTQLRQQQERLENDRHDYENDPFYYTPPTYQYRRGETTYQTNQYGADQLRRASNTGYQKGYEAGRADQQDHWRFDDQGSFAYQDANYGFDGRYVQQDDYNYYFREGFRRGYEDGYYGRRTYGTSSSGSDSLLGTVLNMILNLQPLQ